MQYCLPKQKSVWTVLFSILIAVSLNACSDTNNVSGPPAPAIPGPLSILTTSPLPAGATGVHYNITLTPAGGTPSYTWSLAAGSPALPNGLTLDPSTGNITGAPTATGTTATVFKLQDSTGESVQKALPITVNITPGPLTIHTPSLPNGVLNQSYVGAALSATGGRSPYTWDIISGALPAGLNLDSSSGVISGTPQGGTSQATFRVRDSSNPQGTATKLLSITITQPTPPKITINSLPEGTFRAAYAQVVSATGGSGALGWTVVGGGLPPGLNLNNSSGNISGAPTQTGSFPFTIRVTDQLGQLDEQNFTIDINPPVPPTISGPGSLPSGTVTQPYPLTTLTASGGTAPLTWDSVVTPALPNGLSWDATTHTISGTPLDGSQGTTSHTFTVRDSTNPPLSDTRTYSLTIGLPVPPTITTTTLPNGNLGTAYSQQLQVTGGGGTLTWTIIAGSLPDGLSMDAAGLISGVPAVRKRLPFDFTVQVTDGFQRSAQQRLSITIDLI